MATPFLPYLEGMRGVAALYVVLYHTRKFVDPRADMFFGPAAGLLPFRGMFLMYGYFAVCVFIVLSGFVLTLPIVVRGELAGGVWGFFKRRARRLLPAYYAALTLSVPLYLLALHQDGKSTTLLKITAQWVLHALMLHDLNARLINSIDGPMWSVAVEVQIYIIFAVVLLPVLRRLGAPAFLGLAFVLSLLPTTVGMLRHQDPNPLQIASPWFLGLFALGSMAAFIAYDERWAALRALPWKLVSIATAICAVWLMIPEYGSLRNQTPLPDIVLGISLASGMVAVSNDLRAGRDSLVARVFSWKPLLTLGAFSYSLYLVHYPIMWVATNVALRYPPSTRLLLDFGLFVPAVICVAYLFARVFEFPFLSRVRKQSAGLGLDDRPVAAAASAQ